MPEYPETKPIRWVFLGDKAQSMGLIPYGQQVLRKLRNIGQGQHMLRRMGPIPNSFIEVNTGMPGLDIVTITTTPQVVTGGGVEEVVETYLYVCGDVARGIMPTLSTGWYMEKRKTSDLSILWTQEFTLETRQIEARNIRALNSKVYVAGFSTPVAIREAAIAILNSSDGSVDIPMTAVSYGEYTMGLEVDATGVYIAETGNTWPSAYVAKIEKRSLDLGTSLWSVELPNSYELGNGYYGLCMTQDANFLYVAYSPYFEPDYYGQWCIKKLNKTDGSTVWTKIVSFGDHYPMPAVIAVDSTGLYIGGTIRHSDGSPCIWYIERRDLTTGDLASGWPVSLTNVHADFGKLIYGLALDTDNVYITGAYDYSATYNRDKLRMEKRLKSDASLVGSPYTADHSYGMMCATSSDIDVLLTESEDKYYDLKAGTFKRFSKDLTTIKTSIDDVLTDDMQELSILDVFLEVITTEEVIK